MSRNHSVTVIRNVMILPLEWFFFFNNFIILIKSQVQTCSPASISGYYIIVEMILVVLYEFP